MTAEGGRRRPVHVIESGPAAGVIATAALARAIGAPNALSIDMGGTTAKASIIEGYEIKRTGEFEIGGTMSQGSRLNKGGGFLLRVPAIDIAEVGAGGGSIVSVDGAGRSTWVREARGRPRARLLRPGRARGHPHRRQRGPRLSASRAAAQRPPPRRGEGAPGRGRADRRAPRHRRGRMPPTASTSSGCAGMARAVRAVTIERGRDPRDFTLIAFGATGRSSRRRWRARSRSAPS